MRSSLLRFAIASSSDAPLLFRSDLYPVSQVRLTLAEGNEPAEIAVVQIAPLLVVQRRTETAANELRDKMDDLLKRIDVRS